MGFIANFIRFPAVQTFWKLVKIWECFRQFKGGNFLSETQCRNTFCATWYLPHRWIAIMFLNPDFLHDAGISTIRKHLIGTKWHIYVCMDFPDLFVQNGSFGANRRKGGAMLTPKELILTFGVVTSVRCHFWQKSIKICDRKSVYRQTHTQRETRWVHNVSKTGHAYLIILPKIEHY